MAKTTRISDDHCNDTDIYYNSADFGKAQDDLAEVIRETRDLQNKKESANV